MHGNTATSTSSNDVGNGVYEDHDLDTWVRIMFFIWGGLGDLQPVLALARAVRASGKDVAMFVTRPLDQM
eukprot:scaffold323361_cov37-Prasinocladus_malaysianus.AAC.1